MEKHNLCCFFFSFVFFLNLCSWLQHSWNLGQYFGDSGGGGGVRYMGHWLHVNSLDINSFINRVEPNMEVKGQSKLLFKRLDLNWIGGSQCNWLAWIVFRFAWQVEQQRWTQFSTPTLLLTRSEISTQKQLKIMKRVNLSMLWISLNLKLCG